MVAVAVAHLTLLVVKGLNHQIQLVDLMVYRDQVVYFLTVEKVVFQAEEVVESGHLMSLGMV